MLRKTGVLRPIQLLVAYSTLMEDNVDYFVEFTDVFGSQRHNLVDNFTEEVDISASVVLDTRNQFGNSAFMLK
jgi:hypothetical protein